MRLAVLLVALLLPSLADAQPAPTQPDPAMLQKSIIVLQRHRNRAMDELVGWEAHALVQEDEKAKLKLEIDELKAKIEELQKDRKD